ncbi:hypothetical protein EDB85DRAFT_1900483 [Lactarius pseudohatsudake]|nr:hypothetical protein EDB85DRAFT_1900483 [Lactarius pseudohatsudake]
MGFRFPETLCLAARVAWILALPVVNFLSEILQADMCFRLLPETFYSSSIGIKGDLSGGHALLPPLGHLPYCVCFSDRDPPVVNFLSEILQAGMRFHLLPETLCLTVNIIDRFLSAHVVTLANSLLALDTYLTVNNTNYLFSARVMPLAKLQLIDSRGRDLQVENFYIELGTLPVIRREFTAVLNYILEPVRHPSFFVFPTNTPSHNQHACLTAGKIQGVDALKLPNTPASYLSSAVISNAKPLTRK